MTHHPWRGMRAQTLIVLIVLVSYGAVGARQPAVRTSIRLPLPAAELAANLGLHPDDRAGLLTSIVRLIFDAPDGASAEDERRRAILDASLQRPAASNGDLVPLPLDPSVWRETLLQRNVPATELAGAIFSERSTALLYHGLAALDDEALAWVGPERETLVHLRRNAAVFAAFGRSVSVRAGRVAVPGGANAEAAWAAIVGADPANPAAFVQRLIRGDGRLAWFYDTVMHLEPSQRALLLARDKQPLERLRELLALFESVSPEWEVQQRPFVRPALDPALVLSLIMADDRGLRGPPARSLWTAVFSDARTLMPTPGTADLAATTDTAPVDPAWLARRFSQAPAAAARRRLETFLFAQRVFADHRRSDGVDMLIALRGASLFPALAMTLERIGVADVKVYAAAARTAASLDDIRSAGWRQTSTAQFQAAVAIIDRATRMGGLARDAAAALVASLVALEPSTENGYGSALSTWVQRELAAALPAQDDSRDRVEDAILAACAGMQDHDASAPVIQWEGRRYRVDAAAGELRRLRRIRERQRAGSPASGPLDAQLALASDAGGSAAQLAREQRVAAALTAVVYAFSLGEADGAAAHAGDAAARHDFAFGDGAGVLPSATWRRPREEHGSRTGWRLVGSLLGLDVALARLALRRLDISDMPGEPAMTTSERTAATWTAALFGPIRAGAATPAEIAAAIERGRALVIELTRDRSRIEDVAARAGLSEWRREALRWTLATEPEKADAHFSLLELLWLGSRLESAALDPWGAARLSLDGSLRLHMPRPQPWESLGGRPAAGHLASLAADVGLRVALALHELRLPAAVAPAVMAYAVQDVIDAAQPAYFDDWPAFQRAARDIPQDRIVDYVSAAGADGIFIPLPGPSN